MNITSSLEIKRISIAAYKSKDWKKATNILLPHAKNGDPWAQFYLALVSERAKKYSYFFFKPEDPLFWYEKSAEQGNSWAMHNLARYYVLGAVYFSHLPIDYCYQKAINLYKRSLNLGNNWTSYELYQRYKVGGFCFKVDLEKALYYLRLSAKQGNPKAWVAIAGNYAYGEEGFKKNYVKALMWGYLDWNDESQSVINDIEYLMSKYDIEKGKKLSAKLKKNGYIE